MNNLYLIYGSNEKLVKKEIETISQDYDEVIKYNFNLDELDSFINDSSCISFFGGKKLLILEECVFLCNSKCYDMSYFNRFISDKNKLNTIILEVISDKLDEKSDTFKLLKENAKIIYLSDINQKELPKYVIAEFKKRGYNIDLKTSLYFTDYVGNDIGIILSEIDKMILYKGDSFDINIDDINNISSKCLNDNVFLLCDSIMKKDYKNIFSYYNDLVLLKKEPSVILSMIASQFIFLYDVKILHENNKNKNEIASILSQHPYRVELAIKTDYFSYEVKDIIKKLADIDYKLKTSDFKENSIIERFLLSL